MEQITVFTDGACKNNGRKGATSGIGVYFPDNPELNVKMSLRGMKQTNQVAELYAIFKALKIVKENFPNTKVLVISDSQYSIKCLTIWYKNWEKNNYKDGKVINKELIQEILELMKEMNVSFTHINSHKNPPIDKDTLEYFYWEGNDKADKLAQSAIYL